MRYTAIYQFPTGPEREQVNFAEVLGQPLPANGTTWKDTAVFRNSNGLFVIKLVPAKEFKI